MSNLFGLLGQKLSHSISPAIHKEIFKTWGLNGQYDLFEVEKDKLQNFIIAMRKSAVDGFNVTIPYKIEIIKYLDGVNEEAQNIGAVNTVVCKDNLLYGYNTDYYGIHLTFKRHSVPIENSSAVILGNGGASAAVLQYLLDNQCSDITFVVRDKSKINFKIKDYNIIEYSQLHLLKSRDILINCTPVGMYPNVAYSPVPQNFATKFNFIFDLIYNPLKTNLLKDAADYKITHSNGLYMLIGQALYAEAIWNNIAYDEIDIALIDGLYKNIIAKELLK